jgi:solute carrier family 25 protein 39/40
MSPLELLRTRIQASSQTSNRHIYNSIRVLVQENGWKSLWRGLSSTLWRDVPFSAIYWFSYEHTFAFMKTHEWVSSDFLNSFSSGCVCGSLAAVLTHPFDLLKTIQQISVNTGKDHSKAISMSRVVRKVVRDEGYFGLYRGLGPRLLKVAPACGIMITTYEIGKNYFQSGI